MKAKIRILAVLLAVLTVALNPSLTVLADGDSCQGEHTEFNYKGVCVSCGAKKDGVTALYGNSLTLKDNVEVLFYLDIDTDFAEGATLRIGLERDFGNENKVVTAPIEQLNTVDIEGKTYYVASYGVSAKDISAPVKAIVVGADGTEGTEYLCSAKDYIDTVNAREIGGEITEELKTLVNALYVYGKNAAAVLSGGELQETVVGADFSNVPNAGGQKVGTEIKLEQFSLELRSSVRLRVYFGITSEAEGRGFTVKISGKEVNAVKIKSGVWCIEQDVAASRLGEFFSFVITSGESSLTVNLSALYYAKIMHTQAKTEGEKNLMKAIKLYYDAAVAYVESIQ